MWAFNRCVLDEQVGVNLFIQVALNTFKTLLACIVGLNSQGTSHCGSCGLPFAHEFWFKIMYVDECGN